MSDDRDIWEHFLKKEGLSKDEDEEDKEDLSEKAFFRNHFHEYMEGDSKKDALDDNKLPQGSLKKPKAILDLHHKRVDEAILLIEQFLRRCIKQNLNLALVIVGKGIHSEDGQAILRDAIYDWLRNKGASLVSTFRKAPLKLGGSGAILIVPKLEK